MSKLSKKLYENIKDVLPLSSVETKRLDNNRSTCVLATDFSEVDRSMKDWEKEREAKGNVYKALSDYIICLKNNLEHEQDSYKKYLIEQEIKKLEKEKKKYYVPSVLEMATYGAKKSKSLTLFAKEYKN